MAKVVLASYIKSIHGRLGNVIFYNVKGNQYARAWSMPRNPRTAKQQKNRKTFAEAVKLWQSMSPGEKEAYNIMARGKPLSGYNLFISMYMKGYGIKIKFIIRAAETERAAVSAPSHLRVSSGTPPFIYLYTAFTKGESPHIARKWNEAMPRAG
jgi:hypothetical protein